MVRWRMYPLLLLLSAVATDDVALMMSLMVGMATCGSVSMVMSEVMAHAPPLGLKPWTEKDKW